MLDNQSNRKLEQSNKTQTGRLVSLGGETGSKAVELYQRIPRRLSEDQKQYIDRNPLHILMGVESGLGGSHEGRTNSSDLSDFTEDPTNFSLPEYNAEVRRPIEAEDYPTDRERLQVVLSNDKEKYYADFVTLEYYKKIMEDCEADGEFAGGIYFPGQDRVIIRDLAPQTVRASLLDIIDRKDVPHFFKEI